MNDTLAWTAPQPYWTGTDRSVAPRAQLARPQILRFANDQFMEELYATLERDPAALPQYTATPETWRGPASAPATDPAKWLERKPTLLVTLTRKLQAKTRALAGVNVGAVPAVTTASPLKLYQPGHMRHYLVSGSLVCRRAGLPDREVDAAREKAAFVVRRLFPKTPSAPPTPLPDPATASAWDEYAYVLQGKGGQWRKVGAADNEAIVAKLAQGEERLPLFPAPYTQDDLHRRRLYAGTVPVGRREVYQGATATSAENGNSAADAAAADTRVTLFRTQVLGPWRALVNSVMGNGSPADDPDDLTDLRNARPTWSFAPDDPGDPQAPDPTRPDDDAMRASRSSLQTASWYLLLDLYLFLRTHLPGFWQHLRAGSGFANTAETALFNALRNAAMPEDLAGAGFTLDAATSVPHLSLVDQSPQYDVEVNLVDALRRIADDDDAAGAAGLTFERILEEVESEFTLPAATPPADWPDFLFLFADPWFGVLQPPTPAGFDVVEGDYLSEKIQARIDSLADRVAAALPAVDPAVPLPDPALATMQPADMRQAWYVMRLVYERPECAPFHTTVVSAPTAPFQMAGFFDPDAPARPVRIGLPVDISPAGLRKFDKNAVFVMSDMLCGQIDRMKGITLADLVLSVLPWPFHKGLSVPAKGPCKTGDDLSLGVMCSLSIPIVTIAAIILLMIIVSLLDFVFRWVPYLIMCFPLPGFRGKK